jgi:hypothetical protein
MAKRIGIWVLAGIGFYLFLLLIAIATHFA